MNTQQLYLDDSFAILFTSKKGNPFNNGVLICPCCHSFVSIKTKFCKRCKTDLREPDIYNPSPEILLNSIEKVCDDIPEQSFDEHFDDDFEGYCEVCGEPLTAEFLYEGGGLDLCYVCYMDYLNGDLKNILDNNEIDLGIDF